MAYSFYLRFKHLKELERNNLYALIGLKYDNLTLKKLLQKVHFFRTNSVTSSREKELLVRKYLDLRRKHEIYLRPNA